MRALLNALFVAAILFADYDVARAQQGTAGGNEESPIYGVEVGKFLAETHTTYSTAAGLPSDDILSIVVGQDGRVFAGTTKGIWRLNDEGKWSPEFEFQSPVKLLARHGAALICTAGSKLYLADGRAPVELATLPESAVDPVHQQSLAGGKQVLLGTSAGLWKLEDKTLRPVDSLNSLLGDDKEIRQVGVSANNQIAVAANAGLFELMPTGKWESIHPRDKKRSWAPVDVRGVAFDNSERLWFCSPQGVGVRNDKEWTLITGSEGLPYDDFTTMSAGEDQTVWFGTRMGAIRYDGKNWEYRMAPRWLPENLVRAIAVQSNGTAWFATEKGVGAIERKPMTLEEKARLFEDDIDKYHRRTPYGYVLSVRLKDVADKSEWTQSDSDNDGLWTSMYGAGECFAYAATKDAKAKQRSVAAFEALRFLSQVTQGGEHPAPRGFPARSILPTSGRNPNDGDNAKRDKENQFRDPQWKILSPRWPISADGKWYWKTDTSSDELDGHYFFYALYYDLVADTDAEKQRVREVVKAITDHLMEHDYALVDHDGKPTRWARFGPQDLNRGDMTYQRGLNSLSLLSYLKVAAHVTGEKKYSDAYNDLITKHGYGANILAPKPQSGPGTGNQSDDEMAFMNYYHLLMYETDAKLRRLYLMSLFSYWRLEQPEHCPFFNYVFAASFDGSGGFRGMRFPDSCLNEAADTLKRFPIDRVRWAFKNSHRTDVILMRGGFRRQGPKGNRIDGSVIPIDERSVEYWNHDPWQLDDKEDGKTLVDGASFLLPYYMGLYHQFIFE